MVLYKTVCTALIKLRVTLNNFMIFILLISYTKQFLFCLVGYGNTIEFRHSHLYLEVLTETRSGTKTRSGNGDMFRKRKLVPGQKLVQ